MEKGRRKKIRYIQKMPVIGQFSPRGKPGRPDEIELKIDEYEAIKLADFQGYDQTEGAMAMGISRPSFGRILRAGRKIVANALVNGKIIKIRTSNVQVGVRQRNFPIKDRGANETSTLLSQLREEALRRSITKFSRVQTTKK
ncbi:MAG: DUF134 domain-containing protein [Candidatus Omnitrophica bacterium]|nr:DUF134 domain-containing protein [Candidatus Omnitrophota bacterium]